MVSAEIVSSFRYVCIWSVGLSMVWEAAHLDFEYSFNKQDNNKL